MQVLEATQNFYKQSVTKLCEIMPAVSWAAELSEAIDTISNAEYDDDLQRRAICTIAIIQRPFLDAARHERDHMFTLIQDYKKEGDRLERLDKVIQDERNTAQSLISTLQDTIRRQKEQIEELSKNKEPDKTGQA